MSFLTGKNGVFYDSDLHCTVLNHVEGLESTRQGIINWMMIIVIYWKSESRKSNTSRCH